MALALPALLTGGVSALEGLGGLGALGGLGGALGGLGGLLPALPSMGGGGFMSPSQKQQQQQSQNQQQQLGPFNNSFNPSASASASSSLTNIQMPNVPGVPTVNPLQFAGISGPSPVNMQQPFPVSSGGMSNTLPLLPAFAGGGMMPMNMGGNSTPTMPEQIQPGMQAPLQGGVQQGGLPEMSGIPMSPRGGMSGGALPPLTAPQSGIPAAQAAGLPVTAMGTMETPRMDSPTTLSGGGSEAVTPGRPVDADLQNFSDQIREKQNQVEPAMRGALGAYGTSVGAATKQHDENDKQLRPAYQAAEANVQKARSDSERLAQPKGLIEQQEALKDELLRKMPPAQRAAVERIESGTSGAAPPDPHPRARALMNALSIIGRMGESAYGQSSLIYTQNMGDYLRNSAGDKARAAQQKADQHIYDEYTKQVNEGMSHMLTASNTNLNASKAELTNTRQAMDHNDQQLHSNIENAAKTILTPATDFINSLKGSAGMIQDQATNYDRSVGISQRQQGLGIAQQQADKGEAALNLATQRFQSEKGKQDLEMQNIRDRNKKLEQGFPPTVPSKLKDGDIEDYRTGLLEGIRKGQWSRADANKAYYWEKAHGAE